MNRFREAAEHMRGRLRTQKGETSTVSRAGEEIACGISIVQIDLNRYVETESEFLLEADDVGFLVGVDQVLNPLEQGDLITVESPAGIFRYRVQERNDLQTSWLWHDTSHTQRVIFAKLWEEELT